MGGCELLVMLCIRRLILQQHEADVGVLPHLRGPHAMEDFCFPLVVHGLHRLGQHIMPSAVLALSHELGDLKPELMNRCLLCAGR